MRRTVLALLGALAVIAIAAPAAHAAPAARRAPAAAVQQPTEGGEAIQGTLFYTDKAGKRVAAEGVEIKIEDANGDEIDTVATDDQGKFRVDLPKPGSYSVTLDQDTLPKGVSLQNADRATLTVQVEAGRVRPLLYPLTTGEGSGRKISTTADRAARLAVEGVRFGLVIAMCAIGLSLIYGTTRLVNFAHAEMVTFGALLAYYFNVTLVWPFFLAAVLAIAGASAAGAGLDRFFWRPLRARGTGLIAMMVVSIGVGIFFRYLFLYQFGGLDRAYRQYTLQKGWDIGPLTLVPRDLYSMIISLVALLLVALVLQRTRTGKATRAVADNVDLAESSGIDVDRVITFVWTAGAGLAALGGILQGLSEQVNWQMGFQLLLLMFAGTTLGGLGTAYGALVGSMVVGMAMELSTLWIPTEFKTVTALAILVIVLLVRPQGILGQAERVG
jgi:neutral amino acid transport system permease protein